MAGTVTQKSVTALSAVQSLNGLFAIYKKQGPTSADVLNSLKEALLKEAGMKNPNPRKRKKQDLKIGHGGTLDSAASGVLVVGIGNGTKMLSTMLAGSKKYTVVGELGKATDTLDATGSVVNEKTYVEAANQMVIDELEDGLNDGRVELDHHFLLTKNVKPRDYHVTGEDIEEKLKKFTGDIMQVPPLYSALKKDGKRLSVLLKQGHKVEAKPARPVTVHNLSLRDFTPPHFTLDVECGGGFYVRSLVDDLGKALESCAHVKELIRTKQGQYTLEENTLQEEHWTLQHILQSMQPCPGSGVTEKDGKKRATDAQAEGVKLASDAQADVIKDGKVEKGASES